MTINSIKKHGVRLLNPFRGVMNIIEFEGAEAVTIDGVNWDIYVKDMNLLEDINHPESALITEIRFGHWSKKSGLTRGSIYPSEDFNAMEKQGYTVYDFLIQHADDAPFPLTDSYELWLLDTDNKPLALIASTYAENKLHNEHVLQWTSGNACKFFFRNKNITTDNDYPDQLEKHVKNMSGESPAAQWFKRSTNESIGLIGINIAVSLKNRVLKNTEFPTYFVQPVHDEEDNDFVQYIESLAPFLLTLPSLETQQRQKFEEKARSQALFVEKLHLLYPDICEEKHIKAARVEAQLRKNQAETGNPDDILSPEYIELGISRTN